MVNLLVVKVLQVIEYRSLSFNISIGFLAAIILLCSSSFTENVYFLLHLGHVKYSHITLNPSGSHPTTVAFVLISKDFLQKSH